MESSFPFLEGVPAVETTAKGRLCTSRKANRARAYVDRLYRPLQVARAAGVSVRTIAYWGQYLDTFGQPLLPPRFVAAGNCAYYSADQIEQAKLIARFMYIMSDVHEDGTREAIPNARALSRDRALYNLRQKQAARAGRDALAELEGGVAREAAERRVEWLREREEKIALLKEAQRLVCLPPGNEKRIISLASLAANPDFDLYKMRLWGPHAWAHPAVLTGEKGELPKSKQAFDRKVLPWSDAGFNHVVFGDPLPPKAFSLDPVELATRDARTKEGSDRLAKALLRLIAEIEAEESETAASGYQFQEGEEE
jgi:DNA-binding transcriptional MerR regulator